LRLDGFNGGFIDGLIDDHAKSISQVSPDVHMLSR
jgi:hypothetical protein